MLQDMIVRRLSLLASLLLPGLLLGGCVQSMMWARPNTSYETTQIDAAECGRLARDQAWREGFFYGPPGMFGPPFFGPYGPYGWRHDPFYRDAYRGYPREWRESDLRDFCLRSRGYQLVPVNPT
jgi:hypothetical protein